MYPLVAVRLGDLNSIKAYFSNPNLNFESFVASLPANDDSSTQVLREYFEQHIQPVTFVSSHGILFIMEAAVIEGHVHILKHLKGQPTLQRMVELSVKSGNDEMTEFLTKELGYKFTCNSTTGRGSSFILSRPGCEYKFAIETAAEFGDTGKFMSLELLNEGNKWSWESTLWPRLCTRGDLTSIRFLLKYSSGMRPSDALLTSTWKSLPLTRCFIENEVIPLEKKLINDIARVGCLRTLKFILELFNNEFYRSTVNAAAKAGHLDHVQYLYSLNPSKVTKDTMYVAIQKGHVHIMDWLFGIDTIRICKVKMWRAALGGNYPRVIDSIYSHGFADDLKEVIQDARPSMHRYLTYLHVFGTCSVPVEAGTGRFPYRKTSILHSETFKIQSITCMQSYQQLSSEELRWDDYKELQAGAKLKDISNAREIFVPGIEVVELALPEFLESITASPEYQDQSVEELRWADYRVKLIR